MEILYINVIRTKDSQVWIKTFHIQIEFQGITSNDDEGRERTRAIAHSISHNGGRNTSCSKLTQETDREGVAETHNLEPEGGTLLALS